MNVTFRVIVFSLYLNDFELIFFLLLLLSINIVIAKSYALFGVNLFCLKLGWYKEN